MAKDTITPTNRDLVAATALAILFPTEKSAPLIKHTFASKAGTVTFSAIRAGLKVTEPNLSGDKLTTRVNQIRRESDSVALAAVLQLNQEGFHFSRLNGRELKNGTRTVSVGMANAGDNKATPAKKINDYTSIELLELAKIREQAEKAVTVEV